MRKPFVPRPDADYWQRMLKFEGTYVWVYLQRMSATLPRLTGPSRSAHRHRKAGRA